jgi:glycosyltransferase involved in cell wall biosynthesis
MKQGFIIPVYNHGKTAGPIVETLSVHGLPIILVDDGSDRVTKALLAAAAAAFPLAVLVTSEKNYGKGHALTVGIDTAHKMGLTHALQMDADGQHDAGRAGFFLEQSAAHPEAAICGYPVFDDSIPEIRKRGKKIANTWVRIITLSKDIVDSMCGFRVYPVEPLWRLFHRYHFDQRMGIDIDTLIRMSRENIPLLFYPVRVIYPPGGISHYRYVRDNIRIIWVFIRSFFGMLFRLPLLVRSIHGDE